MEISEKYWKEKFAPKISIEEQAKNLFISEYYAENYAKLLRRSIN